MNNKLTMLGELYYYISTRQQPAGGSPLKFAARTQQRRRCHGNLDTSEQIHELCRSVFACYLALCTQERSKFGLFQSLIR